MKTPMKRLTSLFIGIVLTQACAVREPFRPRFEARRMVEEQLGCANVLVAEAPPSPYARNPLAEQSVRLVAWGCGQVVRLVCSPYAMRNGRCVEDPTYESPRSDEPRATVKVLTLYHSSEGILQRERYRIAGRGEIVRPRDPNDSAFAFPIHAGPTRIQLSSDPIFRHIAHHTWTSTHTRRRGGYNVTEEVEHHSTTVYHYSEAGCARQFLLDAQPGATYRVVLNYRGRNRCDIVCGQEDPAAPGRVRDGCPGFQVL